MFRQNRAERSLPRKEIGWAEIGEEFTRYQLLKTRWFNLYLHRVVAPNAHPECHNHPWTFVALLLKGGYREYLSGRWHIRRPGNVLFRRAETAHIVVTNPGKPSWSLVLTGPNRRAWGFQPCTEPPGSPHQIPYATYVGIYTKKPRIQAPTH